MDEPVIDWDEYQFYLDEIDWEGEYKKEKEINNG